MKTTSVITSSDTSTTASAASSSASTTSPVGLFLWSFSGIMASALAYGWGGWIWQTAVKSDEQYVDLFDGHGVEGTSSRISGLLYGWDMKRLLFWCLVAAVFCVIGE
jgi:hypothetical protein